MEDKECKKSNESEREQERARQKERVTVRENAELPMWTQDMKVTVSLRVN